jgi:hypothetical protein
MELKRLGTIPACTGKGTRTTIRNLCHTTRNLKIRGRGANFYMGRYVEEMTVSKNFPCA